MKDEEKKPCAQVTDFLDARFAWLRLPIPQSKPTSQSALVYMTSQRDAQWALLLRSIHRSY